MNKKFYKSVVPAICAMLVSGLYVVVDGIFVGRGVGTAGLASVNIALPFISLLLAVSMMLSMGGGTLTSIFLGKDNIKKANNIFTTTMLVVLSFAAVFALFSVLMPEIIARALGASDALLSNTANYIRYFAMFSMFLCGSLTLSVFVKNDGNPNLAMYGMIVGAISNVFLDWLFIFPFEMGVIGAALASGLGQLFSCIVLSTHFLCKKGVLRIAKPQKEKGLITEIFKIGTPELITQMSQPMTILCYNYIVISIFGDIGVSAFSVVAYVLTIVISVFVGLAQGLQPLISRSFGEKKNDDVKFFLNKGLKLNISLSIVVYILLILAGKPIIAIFNNDPQLMEIAYNAIVIYGISFIFASVNIVYTTYYLSIKKTKSALIIATSRSFIFNIICIVLVPVLFGESFIWVGIIVAELIVMFVAIVIRKKEGQKL